MPVLQALEDEAPVGLRLDEGWVVLDVLDQPVDVSSPKSKDKSWWVGRDVLLSFKACLISSVETSLPISHLHNDTYEAITSAFSTFIYRPGLT